ncbi:hypothetical protein T484DRAFT_1932007, partial [Baffinella frigidus]
MDKFLGFLMKGLEVDSLFAGGCCRVDVHQERSGQDQRGMDHCAGPWAGDAKPFKEARRGDAARGMSVDPSPVRTLAALRMGHSSVGIPPALKSSEDEMEQLEAENAQREPLPDSPFHSPKRAPSARKDSVDVAACQIKELMEHHISEHHGSSTPRKEIVGGSSARSPTKMPLLSTTLTPARPPLWSAEPGACRRKLELVEPGLAVMPARV